MDSTYEYWAEKIRELCKENDLDNVSVVRVQIMKWVGRVLEIKDGALAMKAYKDVYVVRDSCLGVGEDTVACLNSIMNDQLRINTFCSQNWYILVISGWPGQGSCMCLLCQLSDITKESDIWRREGGEAKR